MPLPARDLELLQQWVGAFLWLLASMSMPTFLLHLLRLLHNLADPSACDETGNLLVVFVTPASSSRSRITKRPAPHSAISGQYCMCVSRHACRKSTVPVDICYSILAIDAFPSISDSLRMVLCTL